ncbi:MAG TPA: hypothetical protein VEI26_08720 [Terriglobales bacterium]|nr:hypothetical protein [Terriglobales bacterium]
MRGWFFVVMLVVALVALGQDATSRAPADPTSATAVTSTATDGASRSAPNPLTQDQIKELIQKVADNDDQNDKKQRDYTYIEREVESRLDGKGRTKSSETKTYEILEIYGDQVQRLIEKNDKPLSAKELAKEDEKIQKIIDKRKNETAEQRKKRLEKEEKEREEGRQFVREIADAYNFSLVGTEALGGRAAWEVAAEPRPGFVPHMKYANYLPKFHGHVWIDQADLQLAKMDVECLDTVSWGLFLARLHKGSRVILEQTRVNDEVWLPLHVNVKADGRLALVKGFNVEDEQTFRDYKKFRTDTKIVGMGEVLPQK